jgi:hypothetical protein
MIVNFKAREISQGARKLAQISILIKKINLIWIDLFKSIFLKIKTILFISKYFISKQNPQVLNKIIDHHKFLTLSVYRSFYQLASTFGHFYICRRLLFTACHARRWLDVKVGNGVLVSVSMDGSFQCIFMQVAYLQPRRPGHSTITHHSHGDVIIFRGFCKKYFLFINKLK